MFKPSPRPRNWFSGFSHSVHRLIHIDPVLDQDKDQDLDLEKPQDQVSFIHQDQDKDQDKDQDQDLDQDWVIGSAFFRIRFIDDYT